MLPYNTVHGFLSLKGFSEAGMPMSNGSFLACSPQYRIRSDEALDTFILSMQASLLSCCTTRLACAMLLELCIFDDITVQTLVSCAQT